MKTNVKLLVLFWMVITSQLTVNFNLAANNTTQWKEVDSRDDIKIFERWISFGDSLKVRERMGQIILNVHPDIILSKIIKIDNWNGWMHNVNSAYLIQKSHNGTMYVYTLFNIPWPFNNRDMVSYVQVKTNNITRETIVEICSTEGLIAPKSNIERISGYRAYWLITPMEKNAVKLTFSCYSTQTPAYPRWLMDPILRKMFFDNLLNFKQQVLNGLI
jgi:hypothetical protein